MRMLMLSSVVVASVAMAQQGPGRGPPPEAVTACNGLASGAACGFTHHGRDLTGACRAGPNGEALACAPAGMPPGGPGGGARSGPPPEAISACASASEGASCSVSFNGQTMTGTCRAPPHGGGALACAPPRPTPPPEAISACASASEGASCSVTVNGAAMHGTCRGHGGEALACAPPRGGPHRGPPPEALAACASSSAGAACTVSFHGQSLTGTCVAGPNGEALACLPPRPN